MARLVTALLVLALHSVSAFNTNVLTRRAAVRRAWTPGMMLETPAETSDRFKKGVKQVATLGPKTFNKEMIEKLFLAGVDVFRLNLSHGAEDKAEPAQFIRELEEKYSRPIGILVDIQGPKHRVGMYPNPDEGTKVMLKKGQKYRFDLDADKEGDDKRVSLPHPDVIEALEIGHRVLIDDGKIQVKVVEKGEGYVVTEVMNDAAISSRKGFNLPDTYVDGAAMTPKDLKDLDFCLKNIDFDWVALSFVQKQEDILQLRELMGDHKGKVLAKIEKPSAIDNLESITDVCDGIMVARGDLGVEMLPEDVPMLQKEIIDECRKQGKPVIVATQMLESMMDNPAPTRAECSDIATAIFDGADAVMLSGESAAGKYPVESVRMQQKVISRVENDPKWQARIKEQPFVDGSYPDAIMQSAVSLSNNLGAKALVVVSKSGASVNRASRMRPDIPIIAVTPNVSTNRALSLQKNVYPVTMDPTHFTNEGIYNKIWEAAKDMQFVTGEDDSIVLTISEPFGQPANCIRVITHDSLKFSE